MKNLLRHPAYQEVEKALRREVWELAGFGAFFFMTGLLLIMLSPKYHFGLLILGILVLSPAVYLFLKAIQNYKIQESDIIKTLNNNSKDIVWVYPFVTQVMPFGISLYERCYIIMKTVDGKELSFKVPVRKKKLLLSWLKRLVPQARFGFSKERETLYGQSPESFLNKNWDK